MFARPTKNAPACFNCLITVASYVDRKLCKILDQIGVLARTVYDTALILSTIAGHDLNDSSSLPVKRKNYTQFLGESLPDRLRIGIIESALNAEGMDEEISVAVEAASALLKMKYAAVA